MIKNTSFFIKAYLQSPILSKSGSTNDNLLINVVQWLYNVFEGWSHVPVNASHMLWDMFLLCKVSKVLQISSLPLHVSRTIKTYLWQHSPQRFQSMDIQRSIVFHPQRFHLSLTTNTNQICHPVVKFQPKVHSIYTSLALIPDEMPKRGF